MKYALTYWNHQEGRAVRLTLTEKDLRQWLDDWPSYALPVEITLQRVDNG